ncbi:hypothetical protein FOQG_19357 [Fusarium oxysporum f. sp. raphani 54005]|uniref:Uncharacterized protein n=1 Tax=Fusarium oxysporum f. sp. raphani 54005 TaxID=1089458 RepID=X0B2A5_FUSOX|nr:hypothetical protein FOQG_19357 [Fusarium oxysporum f. sp. raphani 54005]
MARHKLRLESKNLTPEATAHLRQVIRRQEKYRDVLNQPCITSRDTGSSELPSMSLWLDRTQWPSIYHNTRRDILRALTRVPDRHSLTADYILAQGARNSTPSLTSPRDDEQKLSCILGAFESVIDRCENTVRCTSHNLLCWLLSSRLESRRENPFNLVAERSSEVRYRRIQKQFLAFVIRIYRMSNESLRDIVGVSIKSDVLPQLADIWKHKIWDHVDTLEGIWPVAEMQGIPPTGSQSSHNACDSPGDDGGPFSKTDEEDDEEDDDDVEDWDIDDNDSDYDDSGYRSDTNADVNRSHPKLLTIGPGRLSEVPVRRQDCPKLSAIIYMQRILLLEWALPLREYPYIDIPQRPRVGQFESLNRIRAKYMVLGSQHPLGELVSLRDFGRNIARTEPPSILFHWSSDGETVSHHPSN